MRADPFGLATDDGVTILFEDLDFRVGKGSISSTVVPATGAESPADLARTLAVHLAYPYLFVHEGRIYCIPDSSAQCEVNLFRAIEFPSQWEKAATLIADYPAADSTVFHWGDYWWLFCGEWGDKPNAKLRGWYSSNLFGQWKRHALDPLKEDVRSSRSAGTPFVVDGVLYRPAQDCSETYGGAITINRVLELSPTEFREEPVRSLRPAKQGPYPAGCHTLSAAGSVTLIDGKRRIVTLDKISRAARRGRKRRA